MSNDDPQAANSSPNITRNAQSSIQRPALEGRSLFSIPPPVKRVFDKFPLRTDAENELPLRAPTGREENVLHIFATEEDAKSGRPSFNPACLKWQTYLKVLIIPFTTVTSSNHASPSGMLPFLLPAESSVEPPKTTEPISSNKLRKWASSQNQAGNVQESADIRYEAYASLLDNGIRKAWLYQLYLSYANSSVVHRLYVKPSSSNSFVQWTISYQLRRAAAEELTKASASSTISEVDIMAGAEEAFEALSILLGARPWFFGERSPTLFDASVFAYTHLILDEAMEWKKNKMSEQLKKWENLVQHRESILQMYF